MLHNFTTAENALSFVEDRRKTSQHVPCARLLPYFVERLLSNRSSLFLTPVPLHTPGREMKEAPLELESESDLLGWPT